MQLTLSLGIRHALLPARLSLHLDQAHSSSVRVGFLDILERHCRLEARALPGVGDLGVQLVDLFEGEAFGFVDHAPDEEDADEAAASPNKEDFGAEIGVARVVIDQVGCRTTNDLISDGTLWDIDENSLSYSPIEKPVRCGGHRERLGSHLEREELTSDNPSNWSPGAGKKEDVDADKGNQCLLGSHIARSDNSSNNGDNELADSHSNRAKE